MGNSWLGQFFGRTTKIRGENYNDYFMTTYDNEQNTIKKDIM